MNNSLVPHETWAVQDSSKIQDYARCPRLYFFKYVLGWQPEAANVHLEFGTAFHLGMEILLSEGYTPQAAGRAYEAFLGHYRRSFGEDLDLVNSPKNPSCALRALALYCSQYKDDLQTFSPLHVEVSWSAPVGPARLIYGKTDTICEGTQGKFCLEHKTGGRFSTLWAAQWRQKIQVGAYLHLLYSVFPQNEVYGVVINGVFPHEIPRTKKDGTPYAGEKDVEFHRLIVRRSPESMQAWLVEVNHWFDLIDRDFSILSETSEDLPVMEAFLRNTESCTDYGVCPFLDYCSVWNNPLRYADSPPVGYVIRFWDPRSIEYIKEVMRL